MGFYDAHMSPLHPLAMASIAPLLFAAAAPWHGELHDEIARTTGRILRQPARAELYLTRAELHRLHGDGRAACADLDRARALEPDIHGLALARARLDLLLGWPFAARSRLQRALALDPTDPEAWSLLARLRAEDGDLAAAIECTSRAIEAAPAPDPDLYLQRARWLAAVDGACSPAAIASLDQGLARLGAVPSLELLAVELEMRCGEIDRALERVEPLARRSARRGSWLALRGDLLARAGCRTRARDAYEQGLAAVRALPLRRRATTACLELQRRLARGMAALDESPASKIDSGKERRP